MTNTYFLKYFVLCLNFFVYAPQNIMTLKLPFCYNIFFNLYQIQKFIVFSSNPERKTPISRFPLVLHNIYHICVHNRQNSIFGYILYVTPTILLISDNTFGGRPNLINITLRQDNVNTRSYIQYIKATPFDYGTPEEFSPFF